MLGYQEHFLPNDPHAAFLVSCQPGRLPKSHHYETAVTTALRKSRLEREPLAAIEVLVRKNPDAFLM